MRILVVGAGAVGGYFGARLAQAGRDVTFLVRPFRAEQLQRDGLRILSPHGDLTLTPQTITAGHTTSPFDVILLSVKAQALDHAIADMAPAVGPTTIVYPVLNGMRHMDTLARRFPEQLIGGVAMVSTDLDDQGRIVQITPMQKLTYGELSGHLTPRLRSLDDTLRDAGFDTELSSTITQAMGHKWVMIASLGLINCLFDGSIGQINAVPAGEPIMLQALEECAAVGAACGFPLPAPIADSLRQTITTKDSKLTASMYRDLKKGAPTEVETILGDLLLRAQEHHVPTPLLQAATVRLRISQNKLTSS